MTFLSASNGLDRGRIVLRSPVEYTILDIKHQLGTLHGYPTGDQRFQLLGLSSSNTTQLSSNTIGQAEAYENSENRTGNELSIEALRLILQYTGKAPEGKNEIQKVKSHSKAKVGFG